MREIYESRRRGSKLSESTIENIKERLRSFFAFVKHHQKLELQFSHCTNASKIEVYVNFLKQEQQLQSITIASHLYAVEKAFRFVYWNGPPGQYRISLYSLELQGFHLKPLQLLLGLVEVVREKQGADSSFICFIQLKDSFFKYLAQGTHSG